MLKSEQIETLQQDLKIIFQKNLSFSQKFKKIWETLKKVDNTIEASFLDCFFEKSPLLKLKISELYKKQIKLKLIPISSTKLNFRQKRNIVIKNIAQMKNQTEKKFLLTFLFEKKSFSHENIFKFDNLLSNLKQLELQKELQTKTDQNFINAQANEINKLRKNSDKEAEIQKTLEKLKKRKISLINKILNFITCGLYNKKIKKVQSANVSLINKINKTENTKRNIESQIKIQEYNLNLKKYKFNLTLLKMKILEFKNNYQQEIIKSITLSIKIDWKQSQKLLVDLMENIKVFSQEKFKFAFEEMQTYPWIISFIEKLTLINQNFSTPPSRKNFKIDIKKAISELEKVLKEELAKDYLKIENPTFSLIDITNINNEPIDQVSSYSKLATEIL